jgi:manganese-dependent ADP-ribose/CDP-alcohol diphosphatase
MRKAAPVIGILADPQFASSIPDRTSPDQDGGEDRVQRFGLASDKTREALARMRSEHCAVVLQLGDIIQSDDAQSTPEIAADLDTMCRVFDEFEGPVLHTLGNHCIGRLDRGTVCQELGIRPCKPLWKRLLPSFASGAPSSSSSSYYIRKISESWTIIVLDTTELSGHSGFKPSSPQARESAAYLELHPVEQEPHMIPWNGGCTQRQLTWLEDQLRKAVKSDTRIIVASHHPIHPEAARRTHLAWNYVDIFAILSACPAVRLVVSGHDHVGGACRQSCPGACQIYLTVPAILEASVDSTEYLVLNLDELERHTDEHSAEIPSNGLVVSGGAKARRLLGMVT